jgi:hypothetical protein
MAARRANPPHRVVPAEYRRQEVARRYLQGEYQSAIAKVFNVTQQQISVDLKALRKAWRESALADTDAKIAEELARIDLVEAEAWAAWERSKQPREVTVTEQTDGQTTQRKASVRREGQAGSPRFLERIQKCIEQRSALLGLGTPEPGTVVNLQVNIKTTLDQAFRLAYGTEVARAPQKASLDSAEHTIDGIR